MIDSTSIKQSRPAAFLLKSKTTDAIHLKLQSARHEYRSSASTREEFHFVGR